MRWVIVMLALAACGDASGPRDHDAPSVPPDRHGAGPIELEVRSAYSQLRVRKRGRVRTLMFVDDTGRERVQSRIDRAHPEQLELPYTRMNHIDHDVDLATIRGVFPQVYTILVPGDGNVIALATLDRERRDQEALRASAAALLSH